MPLEQLQQIAARNGGLVSRRQALAAGVTSTQLTTLVRRGVIARVARGRYAVGGRDVPAPTLGAAALHGVVSDESAAAWWGVDLPGPVDRLHVTVPRSRGRWRDAAAGVRLHRATLRPGDVTVVRGTPVTSPLRTALDVARRCSLERAVAVIDSFIRAGLLDVNRFRAAVVAARGRGRLRMQLVATLVDPASGSVLESLTRVLLWRHQMRPPRSQYAFRSRVTGWVGYLDFAWPALRLALECDGYAYHSDPEAFRRDRRRWSALNRSGWRCAVVTWFDVMRDPQYVVDLVRDLLDGQAPAPSVRAS